MLQAMNTGHDGSITTLHSNWPRDTLARLETMVLMAGMDLPIRAIANSRQRHDLIVHPKPAAGRHPAYHPHLRSVGMEGDVVTMQDLFLFELQQGLDERGDFLFPAPDRPFSSLAERLRDAASSSPPPVQGTVLT